MGSDLLGSAGICQDLRGSARICEDLLGSARICEDLQGSARICEDLACLLCALLLNFWSKVSSKIALKWLQNCRTLL